MPSVSVVSPTSAIRADAVVVGVRRTPDGPRLAPGAEPVDAALGGRLLAALRALGATGAADEVLKVPTLGLADFPLVVGTGVVADAGPDSSAHEAARRAAGSDEAAHRAAGSDEAARRAAGSDEAARRAAGAAVRALTAHRRVHLALDASPGALAEGALLGAYAFTAYKSAVPQAALRSIHIAGPAAARAQVRRANVVAEAVALARDLVNTPPNDLYPATFAQRAADLARERELAVEVLDERALRRGRYGGVLGVGQGSVRPPRLVRISYRAARAGGRRTGPTHPAHLALVGKGVTFDSGGLNLKTANLGWMKSDMGGAAAVIAGVLAIAALSLPLDVTVTVPMVENMPSGSAYRPSDVLVMRSGRTVEVSDTDAEGRLILADAITRAAEDRPDRLIEASTLTGAQLVALGPRVIGAMGEPGWRDEVVGAAGDAGEAMWPMPLPPELRRGLDSPVADLQNLPAERVGGMLVAGEFLAEFVPAGLPWTHLDIAGPAYNQGSARDYTPKGGTGAGVRTIIAAVEQFGG